MSTTRIEGFVSKHAEKTLRSTFTGGSWIRVYSAPHVDYNRHSLLFIGTEGSPPKVYGEEEVKAMLKDLAHASMPGAPFPKWIAAIAAKHGLHLQ